VALAASSGWASQQHKAVEEVFFRNEAVSLCLLVNRRTRSMRVIDFRAGPSSVKRKLVLQLARREGMEKIYALVERDELKTWVELGFAREAAIPGFYKRSDAYLLGRRVSAPEEPAERDESRRQSGMRLVAAAEEGAATPAVSPEHERMDRTLAAAKRDAKELRDVALPAVKIAPVAEVDARRAVSVAMRSGRALTAFEPFGRDVVRRYFVATARGGFELYASTESQACFGNAFLELLSGPRTAPEKVATAAALRTLCERLLREGAVSCFSMTPSDDAAIASAFVHAGFRRTGLLCGHLVVGTARKDAIVWSRKLATPDDE
jgi:hypothetical protein